MKRFANIFLFLAIIGMAVPFFVFAQGYGLPDAAAGTQLIGANSGVNATKALPELIGTVVGTVLSFVGVIFFLLILYAGIMWMTAFGNDQKVEKSKEIIISAAIGLVIVLAAYAISRFIFGALAGSTGQGGSSTGQGVMGCCSNSRTGRRIQTLEANCVPDANDPRTWAAGECPSTGFGCCNMGALGRVPSFQESCANAATNWVSTPCP